MLHNSKSFFFFKLSFTKLKCDKHKQIDHQLQIAILKILFNDYCLECDFSEFVTVLPKRRTISTFGAKYEYFLERIIKIQEYSYTSLCLEGCKLNGLSKKSVSLTFEKKSNNVIIFFQILNHADFAMIN